MTENTIVSKERLDELKALQLQYDKLTKQYGELIYQRKLVDAELQYTSDAMDTLETDRRAIVDAITTELGSSGTVDLTTGEFIPDKQ